MGTLPIPPKESMLYEDEWLYVCLARFPLSRGHAVIVWKHAKEDLRELSDHEYDYLMEMVDVVRDALLRALGVEKVYLLYMDEAKQVHWHLVPRYDEQGMNVLAHTPEETTDFSLAPALAEAVLARKTQREIRLPETTRG